MAAGVCWGFWCLAAGGVDGRGVVLVRVGVVDVLVRLGVVDVLVRVGVVEVGRVEVEVDVDVVKGGVVTVVDGVVDAAGVQLPEIKVSPGGTNDDGDTPGAAFTVIVVVAPEDSATVNVHCAEAASAAPGVSSSAPATAAPTAAPLPSFAP